LKRIKRIQREPPDPLLVADSPHDPVEILFLLLLSDA
jgi:hypothetical protein